MQNMKVLIYLLLVPTFAVAQAPSKVLVATAKEVMVDLVSPGTLACIGGIPTNNPQGPPCSPETQQILIAYRVSTTGYQEVTGSAASLINGQVMVVTHCRLDSNYYGHCWGHFVWSVPGAGGLWEGTWGGMQDMITNNISYTAVGFGVGGKLGGLELKWEAAYTGPGPGLGVARIQSAAQPQ